MPAYTDLVRDHHALVYRVALGVLRDSAAAEDVAQDVFLSFFVDPGALDRAQNVRAFVCRAALNRALDVRKAGLRRAVRESAVSGRKDPMGAIETIFRRELREKVWALPEIQRQAVDLHYFQGLTLAETAEVLNIPNGTASRRISDAVATLRKWLSAAAFGGLVAIIESELAAVEAAPVPEGLARRLLGAPRVRVAPSTAPRSGRSSKVVRGATALAVVMLFAVYTGEWIERRRDQCCAAIGGEGPEDAASKQIAGENAAAPEVASTGAGSNAAAGSATVASEIAAVTETEQIIEGFLFRTPEGLCLAGEIVPDPHEGLFLRSGMHRPGQGRVWRLTGGGLDSWPVSDTANFSPFLQDGMSAASAPHVRVRLRALVPEARSTFQLLAQRELLPQIEILDGPEGAFESAARSLRVLKFDGDQVQILEPETTEWGLTYHADTAAPEKEDEFAGADALAVSLLNDAVKLEAVAIRYATISRSLSNETRQLQREEEPAPENATVLEVLEVEALSDAWLDAWRDLYAAASQVHSGDDVSGQVSARAALAVRVGDALRRARLARAGQSPVAWRIRMEHKFSSGAVAVLAAEGLAGLMPGVPTEAELREAFLAADSPEGFRAILESRWGVESLALTIDVLTRPVFRPKGLGIALDSKSDSCFRNYEIEIASSGVAEPIQPAVASLSELVALSPEDFLAQQSATREWKSRGNLPAELRAGGNFPEFKANGTLWFMGDRLLTSQE
ncbi:MAG: RNA polymerase sigma factor sigma-70 [Planctomycetota bacterium]|nr:MAG: RNA polymerase sigma factor sigma-70 [Planctomycetota bacterium]